MSAKVENKDNYKLLSTSTVLFGLDKSELTMEAKAQLDAEVRKIGSNQHFVIEVEGFTDKTGPARYNLQLSRERANSVVRYLTTTGRIPLYRIQLVGYGSEEPVADNSTRRGREENRRVDVKLFGAADNSLNTETEPVSPETGNPEAAFVEGQFRNANEGNHPRRNRRARDGLACRA